MRIISTTLVKNNEDIIDDALRSVVDWVDACLLVDTGCSDRTVELARGVAGEKLCVVPWPWQGDFSKARNFCLQKAYELGYDWAITLDSDERIHPREDIRALLETHPEQAWLMNHETRTYCKVRAIRLPAASSWTGPTHESYPAYLAGGGIFPKSVFSELGKTSEQYEAKFERDIQILEKQVRETPHDPRWWYYLGASYQDIGQHEKAIECFFACANQRGWSEEGAWAMYRCAECQIILGKLDEAVHTCARGLSIHAGVAELAWLAAFASFKLDRKDQAQYWARMAIPCGNFTGMGRRIGRIGFRNPCALYEGPYDILRFCASDERERENFSLLYQAAIKERTNDHQM